MSLVEVTSIMGLARGASPIAGANLEHPGEGTIEAAGALRVGGWAVGRSTPVRAVELLFEGRPFRRLRLNSERPDVAAAFPAQSHATLCGFDTKIALPPRASVVFDVAAVLADGSRHTFARVSMRRRWPRRASVEGAPLVSVIIPCYNQAEFLPESIGSAAAQTYPNIEVVVVDDGSPDNTAAVAQRFPGIVYVRKENGGLAEARNRGIAASAGEFLLFLDADDRITPTAIADGLAAFDCNPAAAMVSGRFRRITSEGATLSESVSSDDQDTYAALLRRNYIHCPAAVLYRRSALQAAGGFDPAVNAVADMEMYLRMSRSFPVASHDSIVAEYRQHGQNMSGNAIRMSREMFRAFTRERRYTRNSPELREAWEAGWRFRRKAWGELTSREVVDSFDRGDWSRALAGVSLLLRYAPRLVWRVLSIVFRSTWPISVMGRKGAAR